MIAIHGSWAEIEVELERLDSHPTPKMYTALEDVLSETFVETQSIVHVITGSLRGSGKTGSKVDDDSWSGFISYGGPSPGFPNDPVVYAWYERRRGGAHDFFVNVHLADARFEQAILDNL